MSSSSSPSHSPSARPLTLPPPPHSSSPSPESKRLILRPTGSNSSIPPKRSLPLPWTHEETLALIQSYREKWYSLKKGQLKAFQWEEVATAVASRCGFDEPSKTSTQCRHKIEKLRKRYRSELQKPYTAMHWEYFELMDQMERGPMPLNALPIAAVKPSGNANSNSSNHGYGSLYSSSADYYAYRNSINSGSDDDDDVVSDESDEKWNSVHGVEASIRNKSNSVNNISHRVVNSRVRNSSNVSVEREFGGNASSLARVLRNSTNGKRKVQYYDADNSKYDDGKYDNEYDGQEGSKKGIEMGAAIREFADSFMKMEDKKIEVMRETEVRRMQMEKKRTEMILGAQRKLVDTIGRVFGAHYKKPKMAQET